MLTELEPILWPLVTLIVGIAGKGIFDLITARSVGSVAKMPTVEQIWARLDKVEASLSRVTTDLSTVRRVFRSYVDRVQRGGKTDLTDDERAALDETENHQEAKR